MRRSVVGHTCEHPNNIPTAANDDQDHDDDDDDADDADAAADTSSLASSINAAALPTVPRRSHGAPGTNQLRMVSNVAQRGPDPSCICASSTAVLSDIFFRGLDSQQDAMAGELEWLLSDGFCRRDD